MSSRHCSQAGLFDCIHDFVVAGISNALTEERWSDFERLLLKNDDAFRLYIEYVRESDLLQAIMDATPDEDSSLSDLFVAEQQEVDTPTAPAPSFPAPSFPAPSFPAPSFPAPSFPATLLHNTVGFFSSGWPLAYLMATLICGLGLVIGAVTHVSQPVHVARQSPPLPSPLSPLPSTVGQITGMADCRWADMAIEPALGASVPLGHKYSLASGLMEIAYDTGAKVVLQGPVTYEVESAASGFLSVGKLTARIGGGGRGTGDGRVASGRWLVASEKSEIRNPKSEISNPQSPAPRLPSPAPLFSVRTPTAVVTDLGTEFGVEVNREGDTETHVLQGVVETRFLTSKGEVRETVRLHAGEARQYRRATGQLTAIPAQPTKFLRRLDSRHDRWLAYSRQLRMDPDLVAYYTFEKHNGRAAVLPNQSAAGSMLDGRVDGAEWVYGRVPGKLALYFHGVGPHEYVEMPRPERLRTAKTFSVALWCKVERFGGIMHTLMCAGAFGWRLHTDETTDRLVFSTLVEGKPRHWFVGRANMADRRWRLVVAVQESAEKVVRRRLYVDGQLDAAADVQIPAGLPAPWPDGTLWLGAQKGKSGQRGFWGWIDEVAIFVRALSAEEIAAMFHAGQGNMSSSN